MYDMPSADTEKSIIALCVYQINNLHVSDPHAKDKTVSRPFYILHDNHHAWENMVFILRRGPVSVSWDKKLWI